MVPIGVTLRNMSPNAKQKRRKSVLVNCIVLDEDRRVGVAMKASIKGECPDDEPLWIMVPVTKELLQTATVLVVHLSDDIKSDLNNVQLQGKEEV